MASFQRNGTSKGAGTTDTSVLASIEDLLREHERSVEQQHADARRRDAEADRARTEAAQRAEAAAEASRRAAAEEARRLAFEEQRRAAEIAALREATVQRARMEAEAQARLAELTARQEHERHLSALNQDTSKKKWKLATTLTAIFLCVAVGGGGVAIKLQYDKQRAAESELADLRGQIAEAEQEKAAIKAQLQSTRDPQRIAELTKELDDKNAIIGTLSSKLGNKGGGPGPKTTATVTATAATGKAPQGPCRCLDGDPTCSCIKI
jgi:colicin import membrane protein